MSEPQSNSPHGANEPAHGHQTLRDCVRTAMERYFKDLDGHAPGNLYHLVISEIEAPVLEVVMQYTGGNQTRAAEVLGINRSTLRKKLREHGIE